jgi:hypothetical protein
MLLITYATILFIHKFSGTEKTERSTKTVTISSEVRLNWDEFSSKLDEHGGNNGTIVIFSFHEWIYIHLKQWHACLHMQCNNF